MSLTLSKAGYESMEHNLEALQQKLQEVRLYKNQIAVENGNVWHDNQDFEQCEITERRILREISDIKEKLQNATVVEQNFNFDIVDYDAYVTVSSLKNGKDKEVFTVLICDSDEISEDITSANSPLGKTIFKKEVGFVGSYTVEDVTYTVEILKIEY